MSTLYVWICPYLKPFEGSSDRFFGFSEFLSSLALIILAWSLTDTRYKFRVKTASIPIVQISYYVTSFIGIVTLLTELWRIQKWPVLNLSLIHI